MHMDIFRETHRLKHLWSEHAAVADLNPFAELRVESEDLERWLEQEN